MNQEYIFDFLEKVASDNPYPQARLASAVVRKGKLLGWGINQKKSHPFQAKYGKNKESIFLHAEISAIKDSLRFYDVGELENCSLLTVRVKHPSAYDRSFIRASAAPCIGCLRAIVEFGIKDVLFTNEKGEIEKL